MKLEKTAPTSYKLTLHTYELATLISAMRWISEGAEGSLSPEVTDYMKKFLKSYESQFSRLKPEMRNQTQK